MAVAEVYTWAQQKRWRGPAVAVAASGLSSQAWSEWEKGTAHTASRLASGCQRSQGKEGRACKGVLHREIGHRTWRTGACKRLEVQERGKGKVQLQKVGKLSNLMQTRKLEECWKEVEKAGVAVQAWDGDRDTGELPSKLR